MRTVARGEAPRGDFGARLFLWFGTLAVFGFFGFGIFVVAMLTAPDEPARIAPVEAAIDSARAALRSRVDAGPPAVGLPPPEEIARVDHEGVVWIAPGYSCEMVLAKVIAQPGVVVPVLGKDMSCTDILAAIAGRKPATSPR